MENSFKIPDNLGLTENEMKGLNALSQNLTKQFNEFSKDKISKEDMLKEMKECVNKWAEENNISKEKIQSFENSLKEQGEYLSKMKGIAHGEPAGLKSLFVKNYNTLKESFFNKTAIEIKANPDVIDPTLVMTTSNTVTSTTGAPIYENYKYDDNFYLKRSGRQYIDDLADTTIVAQVPEVYVFDEEGDTEGAIAIVKEGEIKPQLNLEIVRNQALRQKAAGYISVTEEVMIWRTRLWARIKSLFQDKVLKGFNDSLINSLTTNYTSSYTGTSLDGTIASPTDFDAIIAMILQLENLNFQPDTIVLNPADKWKLAMATTDNGQFILPFIQNGGEFKVLFLNTITSTKVPAGQVIVAESGIWKIERGLPILKTALVNDDAIKNRLTIIGEIYFIEYLPSNNAGGIVMDSLNTVKEALKTISA